MPTVLLDADMEFLRQVRDLAGQGLNQLEIARSLGLSLTTLRSRLERIGFTLRPYTDVRTTLTGESFTDLVETGELVPQSQSTTEAAR